MKKIGNQTYELEMNVSLVKGVSLVGRKEGEGPLSDYFDFIEKDDKMGEKTFEKGERKMFFKTISECIKKSGLKKEEIDLYVGGDLMNQLVSSNYTASELEIPFLGLYNACATMAESYIIGSTFLETGGLKNVICATGSHFSTAERQYRYPYDEVIYEFPAGKVDKGEDPIDAAKRELEEETGYLAQQIECIGLMYPSCAYTDEIIYLYVAHDLVKTKQHLDENENVEVLEMSLQEVFQLIQKNQLKDAKSLCALQFYFTKTNQIKI